MKQWILAGLLGSAAFVGVVLWRAIGEAFLDGLARGWW